MLNKYEVLLFTLGDLFHSSVQTTRCPEIGFIQVYSYVTGQYCSSLSILICSYTSHPCSIYCRLFLVLVFNYDFSPNKGSCSSFLVSTSIKCMNLLITCDSGRISACCEVDEAVICTLLIVIYIRGHKCVSVS